MSGQWTVLYCFNVASGSSYIPSDTLKPSLPRIQHALKALVVSGLHKGFFASHEVKGKGKDRGVFPLMRLLASKRDSATQDSTQTLSPLILMTFLSQVTLQSSQEAAGSLCTTFVKLLQSVSSKHSSALSRCFRSEPNASTVCTIFLESCSRNLSGVHNGIVILRFVAHLLLGQVDSASELLIDVISSTWRCLPLGHVCSASDVGKKEEMLCLAASLQVLLNVLNHAAVVSVSIETDTDGETEKLWRAAQQLVGQYQTLRYLGGLVLRCAVLFLSLSSPKYAAVTHAVLSTESQVDYGSHLLHLDALCAQQEQERSRRNSRVRRSSNDSQQDVEADDGFKYLRTASKEECEEYLRNQPVGTFVVRLSPSSKAAPLAAQQLYLCFLANPAPEAGQDITAIRHAVIRREEFGADVVMYRCGSVGPFPSLAELLIEISNRLPSPLRFHHSLPAASSTSAATSSGVSQPSRDVNARLWAELDKLMPKLVLAFASSLPVKRPDGSTAAGVSELLSAAACSSDDESKATAVTEDSASVGMPADPSAASPQDKESEGRDLWLLTLHMLALQTFLRQNEPMQDLLQRAYTYDIASTYSGAGEGASALATHKSSNLAHLKSYFLGVSLALPRATWPGLGEESFASAVLAGLSEFAKELENRVRCRLLSPPDRLQRSHNVQNQDKDAELLAVEKLLQLLIKKSQMSSGSDTPLFRPVKFSLASSGIQGMASSLGYGLGSVGSLILSDCCDATEFLHALNRNVFELITILQPDRMSPVPGKSGADGRYKSGSKMKMSKYSYNLNGDDSEDEMAMHYVDPGRAALEDSESDDGGNLLAGPKLSLPDAPIDFTASSPTSPQRVAEASKEQEDSATHPAFSSEGEANIVMPARSSPFIMVQQSQGRGGSNTSLVEQALEERRVRRANDAAGKKNIGDLWHGYVAKVKTKIDKFSTNLKASQQSSLTKVALLSGNAAISRAPSAASIQRDIIQALVHVLDIMQIDPMQATSNVCLDNASACFVVTDKVVERMLAFGLLVQVVKPSELAFGVPQSFYHYVDAFECNVVQDHTMLGERCKIGRLVYKGVNTASSCKGLNEGCLSRLFNTFSPLLDPDSSSGSLTYDALTNLGSFLKIEEYVLQAISQADVTNDLQRHVTTALQSSLPPYSDLRHMLHRFHSLQQSTYFLMLESCLYRNALLRSLKLRYRLVALLQVDVYHLKEVLAVTPQKSRTTASPPSLPHSMHFNNQASQVQLSPVHQMHTQSLEVYGSFRLTKKAFEAPGQQSIAPLSVERSTSNSLLSDGLFALSPSSSNLLRFPSESASVSTIKRLEAMQTVATSDSNTKAAAMTQQLVNGSVLLPQVSHSSDYDLRLQSLFRLPLPEHISTLSCARQQGTDLQSYPYSHLTVCIFEKTFFSDVKVGEVDISLLDLGDKNVVRDWFPLYAAEATGKIGVKPVSSWLVFMQVKLRQVVMQVDQDTADSSAFLETSSITHSKEVGSKISKVSTTRKGGNLLGQLEDFF
eukprot:gene29912-36122_t